MDTIDQAILDKWAAAYENEEKKPSQKWIDKLDTLNEDKLNNKLYQNAGRTNAVPRVYCILEAARKKGLTLQLQNPYRGALEFNGFSPVLNMLFDYNALDEEGQKRVIRVRINSDQETHLEQAEDMLKRCKKLTFSQPDFNNIGYYGRVRSAQFIIKHDLLSPSEKVQLAALATRSGQTILSKLLEKSLPENYRTAATQDEDTPDTGWQMINQYTISHIQNLPDQITLQDVFNFESKECIRIVRCRDKTAPSVSQSRHGFDLEKDRDALQEAYNVLVEKGGTPPQIDFEKQADAVLAKPLKTSLKQS